MSQQPDIPESPQQSPLHSPRLSWGWLTLALSPLIARLLATQVETNWWGLNALAFTENWLTLTFISLALALILIWLTKQSPQAPSQTFSKVNTTLSLALALLLGLAFFTLGSDSHLFGSTYALIGSLKQFDELYLHHYAYLATKIVSIFYNSLTGVTDRALNDSAIAIQTLSALSGALSVFVWLKISSKLARNKAETIYFFSAAVLSGGTLLFFGSGEYYAPAVVMVSLIILSFVTMIKSETASSRYRSAGALALLSILAPFYLAQLIFILPATVFMLGLGLAPGPKRERLWAILSLVTLGVIVGILYWQAQTDLWIQARIVGLAGKPPEFEYTLFGLRRIFDLLNSAFILWPLFPLTLWLCLRYTWQERCDHLVGGLAMLTLSFAVWIFISDFPNGSAREITTIAMFALPASVLAAYLWIKRFSEKTWFGRTTLTIVIAGVLTFAAMAPVYVDGEAGVQYLDHDYKTRKKRYLSGLVNFRDHYFFKKEFPKADQWEWSFTRRSPAFLDHRSIRLLYNRGDFTESLDRLTLLLATNPYWADLYSTQAASLQALRRLPEALQAIDKGLQLDPDNPMMLLARGNIFSSLNKPDSAEAMYLGALRYDSRNVNIRKDLGLFYIGSKRTSAAEKQGQIIFEDNPISAYSFLLVGLAAYDRQDQVRARRYLSEALKRGLTEPEAQYARLVLGRL